MNDPPVTSAPVRWWRAGAFLVVVLGLTVGGAIGEAYPFQPDDRVYRGRVGTEG